MEIATITIFVSFRLVLWLHTGLLLFLTVSIIEHVCTYILLNCRELARSILNSAIELCVDETCGWYLVGVIVSLLLLHFIVVSLLIIL